MHAQESVSRGQNRCIPFIVYRAGLICAYDCRNVFRSVGHRTSPHDFHLVMGALLSSEAPPFHGCDVRPNHRPHHLRRSHLGSPAEPGLDFSKNRRASDACGKKRSLIDRVQQKFSKLCMENKYGRPSQKKGGNHAWCRSSMWTKSIRSGF